MNAFLLLLFYTTFFILKLQTNFFKYPFIRSNQYLASGIDVHAIPKNNKLVYDFFCYIEKIKVKSKLSSTTRKKYLSKCRCRDCVLKHW